jgi:hypothetical protein
VKARAVARARFGTRTLRPEDSETSTALSNQKAAITTCHCGNLKSFYENRVPLICEQIKDQKKNLCCVDCFPGRVKSVEFSTLALLLLLCTSNNVTTT